MLKPVILDTNLFLLLLVGETDRSLIARHKRLQAYELVDFDWLQATVKASSGLLLCPNVVSETSNLIRYIYPAAAQRVAMTLKLFARTFSEIYIQSGLATDEPDYSRLGVTDAVLIILSKTAAMLITDDLDLALAAKRQSQNVLNYSHIRAARYE